MSPCPSITRLGALVRGELDETETGAIEDHLEGCPACRQGIDALSDWAMPDAVSALDSRMGIGPRSWELLDRLARPPCRQCGLAGSGWA